MSVSPQFFNRELSWLEFNARVLEEATDPTVPLLERFNFLSIFSSNLDEFYMVRLAGVFSQIRSQLLEKDPSGHTPKEVAEVSKQRVEELVKQQYETLNKHLLPQLFEKGYSFISPQSLSSSDYESLEKYFVENIASLLTPMAIDQSRPFPFIIPRRLYILIKLRPITETSTDRSKKIHSAEPTNQKVGEKPNEASGHRYLILPVPTGERVVATAQKGTYILLEDVIREFAPQLFIGYTVESSGVFRITRDADLNLKEDEVSDLLSAVENELKTRERGVPVRFEFSHQFPKEFRDLLFDNVGNVTLHEFEVDGPLDLKFLMELHSFCKNSELLYELMPPIVPSWFDTSHSIFSLIEQKDRFLHVPYESYEPVIKFIETAADDPKVLAIKMTLYRTSGNSRIVKALKKAAWANKQVSVLVELKARFDEARNITWARELEKAGCHVVYGLIGMKIHAKLTLVIRKEERGIVRLVHMSTGNYNESTAKLYTDYSLFTANPSFGREVAEVFNVLTGYSEPPRWKNIICAPLDLRDFLMRKISQEIYHAKNSKSGSIFLKLNALIDYALISELYKASQAGVEITILSRGMCRLVPGVPGLSENIRVLSLVGRYLEHTRICFFNAGGEKQVFLSSADWMERNLDRRIEVLFPITDEDIKSEILDNLNNYSRDNCKIRELNSEGRYIKPQVIPGSPSINSQMFIYSNIKSREEKNRQRNNKKAFVAIRNHTTNQVTEEK